MRLLLKGELAPFAGDLSKLGAECKVVNDPYIATQPIKKIYKWRQYRKRFDQLIKDFNPDLVVSGPGHFGTATLKSRIPLITYLAGDYWHEMKVVKRLHHNTFPKNLIHDRSYTISQSAMHGSRFILTVSKHLERIAKEHLPDKHVYTIRPGIDPSVWYQENGMELKHPCVGLIQKATVRDKTKEMLVLKGVLENLPDITFYWCSGSKGRYIERILTVLQKYSNFKYLGNLSYPDKIRQFLSEIDIYILLTGLDMMPKSLKEAMIMRKPTIATNVGGVPEIMEDGKSGFLVGKGDAEAIVEKISYLLENQKLARRMGSYGRELILKNFSPADTAEKFLSIVKAELNLD